MKVTNKLDSNLSKIFLASMKLIFSFNDRKKKSLIIFENSIFTKFIANWGKFISNWKRKKLLLLQVNSFFLWIWYDFLIDRRWRLSKKKDTDNRCNKNKCNTCDEKLKMSALMKIYRCSLLVSQVAPP